ncbi:hypothetical protein [Roseateles sp.]|uniref:hypothetical protein n=1 Tax=Roseateles sp. TaxID=1971397 RepID=UPI00395C3BF1
MAQPSYQAGTNNASKRAVADVAFNANPYTGQYVATMAQGSTSVELISARRHQPLDAAVGRPAGRGQCAARPGRQGLARPAARHALQQRRQDARHAARRHHRQQWQLRHLRGAGYDTPTGLGTPQGSAVLTALSGATVTASTAAISSLSVSTTPLSGKVGSALAATIGLDLAGASSAQINISGAPQGVSFSASASGIQVSWASPAAGSYTLQVSLSDNLGRTAQAAVAVSIAK